MVHDIAFILNLEVISIQGGAKIFKETGHTRAHICVYKTCVCMHTLNASSCVISSTFSIMAVPVVEEAVPHDEEWSLPTSY